MSLKASSTASRRDPVAVAFDMRDPLRSGIARVARSISRAFVEIDTGLRYDVSLCGPLDRLQQLEAGSWRSGQLRQVSWDAGRLAPQAELSWPAVSRATAGSVWYFPHWDVPWIARPRRSVMLLSDVIPLTVPGATSPLRACVARHWIRYSALRATRVVTSTEAVRSDVLDLWPDLEQKVRVVPLGVERTFFGPPPPLSPEIHRIAELGPFMISVGNQKPHKNLVMGPEVLARQAGLRWIVVGERFAGWEAVIRRAVTLGVADRMHVLDPLPDAHLHALYSRAVCLFFPSRAEGFGLPLLEALAAGTRVVAGAASASVEVLGGHGYVCPLDDRGAFADAVGQARREAAPDPEKRAHAAAYTWERSARAIADLVDEISD